MVYLGKKPGRRKQDGGHERIDISVNGRILKILDVPENRSEYIRYCIDKCTETQWITFEESSVTVSDGLRTSTAVTVSWVPHDAASNAILSTYCTFEHQCEGKGFRFRLRINGADTSFIRVRGFQDWSSSQVYTDWSFSNGIKALPNQNSYTIEFQVEPEGASDCVRVRDICFFFEVIDGMPAPTAIVYHMVRHNNRRNSKTKLLQRERPSATM